jgi:phosphatidylglycerol:prolipoprotein diacylglycerol transferase
VPQGGLVVYGSVLFGLPAGLWFCRKRGLAPLAVGDIIAPSMLLGLALGRIGCFLNGCCYGGVCLGATYAVTFPLGSPPYAQHAAEGWHTGIWLKNEGNRVVVAYIAPQDRDKDIDLKPGDEVESINGAEVASLADARKKLATAAGVLEIETGEGRVIRWHGTEPPPRSVPVHPAQLYATIDAALLALILWLYFPFRRREGEVFAIMLIVHPVSRFFLEMIRVDEPGQFGTSLSISQWISIGIFIAGIVLLIWLERPRQMANPKPA